MSNESTNNQPERRFKTAHLARLTLFKIAPSLGAFNLFLLGVILIVGGVLPIIVSISTALLVGSVPDAVDKGFGGPAGRVLVAALIAVAVSYLIQQVLGPFQATITEAVGRRLDGKLRERVMRAVLSTPGIAHLEDPKLLDEVAKARTPGPAGFTPGAAVAGLVGIGTKYVQMILYSVLLLFFMWWVPLARVVIILGVRYRFVREYFKMVEIYAGKAHELRRSQYFFGLGTRPAAAKEARTFGLREWFRHNFSAAYLPVMQRVWKTRATSVRRLAFANLILSPFDIFVYWLLIRSAVSGRISVAALTAFLIAMRGMGQINALSNDELAVEFGMVSIPAVLKLEEVTAAARLELGRETPEGLPREGISFENVSFRYPGGGRDIYTGLDLFIPAGRSLAVVGPNGAGKTTLIKLLCRLYDPTAGVIRVDGKDLREFDPFAWQKRVAAIFQDFVRYELTARENVQFGAIELPDEAHLIDAAQKSGATQVIENLPRKWETILSRRYKDGADLSGGEWQRVALARALHAAAARPGVLVLDEPTANLDVRAEAEIYERFLELTQGLTTILISHRFSTVRSADQICVIDGGRIAELGTHEELIALGKRYARMFNLQAARFVDETAESSPPGSSDG